MTKALHIQNKDNHAVVIGALRVIVEQCDDGWFAQGVEIDYAASGDSLEDVQTRFEHGLSSTIKHHIETFGTISRLLKFAPEEEWAGLVDAQEFDFSLITSHSVNDKRDQFPMMPFQTIAYMQQQHAT